MVAATGKRRRAAAFSEHERYVHKSSVLLQREGKKIRAFLVRKALQQLKQLREQLQTKQQQQQTTTAAAAAEGDDADERKAKRAAGKLKKMQHQVERLETELALLKTLELQAVVSRAFEQTGLSASGADEEDDDDEDSDDDEEQDGYGNHDMYRGAASAAADHGDDDGFDSEEYENRVLRGGKESDDDSDSDSDSGDDAASPRENTTESTDAPENSVDTTQPSAPAPATDSDARDSAAPTSAVADAAIVSQLVDRVLAHKQMQPFLDAIRQ
ncbi:hypothetical protein PINS_up006931 [Pythium insidiosum]|nr:hypothetical protein PINS_up006931 [Pythium insidiosum]